MIWYNCLTPEDLLIWDYNQTDLSAPVNSSSGEPFSAPDIGCGRV